MTRPATPGPETEAHHGTTLKRGSLGVPAIVFFVVATAAPLAAVLGAGPVVFIFSGVGGPAMYVIAATVLLLFGVGFAAMSRYATSAGGFAAFASKGLGRYAGYLMAGVAVLAYAGMLIGLFGQFAVFAADLFSTLFGWSIPWQVIAFAGVVLIGAFGYLDIQLSASVLGVLMILEVLILVIFDVVVIATGGAGGINFDAFRAENVFTPGMGVGLLFAFACFVGFEATVIYGEEAKRPKVTIPRATYASILVIGVIYTVTMWALGLAYGSADVQEAATADPVEFVFAANTQFVGAWSTLIMRILVVTSLIAVLLAFHNTLSRYLFSLGRARFLSERLGHTHRRYHSPSVASVVLSIITALVLLAFVIANADPFTTIYLWLVGVGTLGVLVLQAAGAAAVIGYFVRNRRSRTNAWTNFIAPGLGGLGLLAAIVLAVINFPLLTGVTEGPATLLPWLLVLAAIAGLIIGAARSRGGRTVDLSTGVIQVDDAVAADPIVER
ncbi:APC family permease [Microbacterium sp. Leaf288]|uniref:APC family permease n=1 Tax=Microbacterium sp. Leaf288 TaxID=1736323 RepID=UPI0009E82FE7|nr:APC family permease [Microbacterium sp. Leaf288]